MKADETRTGYVEHPSYIVGSEDRVKSACNSEPSLEKSENAQILVCP